METSFHHLCVFFQVILAYESIVLCKCSGKYIDIYFILKITFCQALDHDRIRIRSWSGVIRSDLTQRQDLR